MLFAKQNEAESSHLKVANTFQAIVLAFQCLMISKCHIVICHYSTMTLEHMQIVRPHNSKFQANCALSDTSIKFGTLIAIANTSIFRYSAKMDVDWFPWKPHFFKKLMNFLCSYPIFSTNTFISMLPTYLPSSLCLSTWRVALNYMFPWKRKIKISHLLKIKESSASCWWASGWLDHCLQ